MEPIKTIIENETENNFRGSGYQLSKKVREKLKELTTRANGNGPRVVRWVDLLECGVENISDAQLKTIHDRRNYELAKKNR